MTEMVWLESTTSNKTTDSGEIVDLSFKINCSSLPADNHYALFDALRRELPWIEQDRTTGIHPMLGAASGNGWSRPQSDGTELLQLSKRTRLYLRTSRTRIHAASQLTGKTIDIDGHSLEFKQVQVKPLFPSSTLLAKSVLCRDTVDEAEFTQWAVARLAALGINVTKMLCGLNHQINSNDEILSARSVLLADLNIEQGLKLQQNGLGDGRLLGCGIFVPHKSLAAVGSTHDDD